MNAPVESRADRAERLFREGFSCSQSVAAAFSDLLPIDETTTLMAMSAFGGGFARTRNVCGAISAVGLVSGLLTPLTGDPRADKTAMYAEVGSIADKFGSEYGSIVCSELLKNTKKVTRGRVPQPRDPQYYKDRPCIAFVRRAAELLEEHLTEK